MGFKRMYYWITKFGSFALFKFMLFISTTVLCFYVIGFHTVRNRSVRLAIPRAFQPVDDGSELDLSQEAAKGIKIHLVEGLHHHKEHHSSTKHVVVGDLIHHHEGLPFNITKLHDKLYPDVPKHMPSTDNKEEPQSTSGPMDEEVDETETKDQTSSPENIEVKNSTTTESKRAEIPAIKNTNSSVNILKNVPSAEPAVEPPLKKILLWNHFFLKEDFGLPLGGQLFKEVRCPKKCNITIDNEELPTSDAVVYHAFHLKKDLRDVVIPKRYSQKQIFVFFLLENPHRSRPGIENIPYNDVFNMTFTYLDDPRTDLFNPYGEIRLRWVPNEYAVPSIYTLVRKNKTAVFLVSNCNAPSSRYEYVEELAKYVDVEVIGKCGLDLCPSTVNCMRFMDRRYMFYLAFENGYCKDYVTEKVFRTLQDSHMIPIVLGGANYTKMLPVDSFIDVRDYSSPEALAEYMKSLREDHFEYMKYFQWKRFRMVIPVTKIKYNNFCRLCMNLYKDDYPFKSGFNISEYWEPSVCKTGDDERRVVHLIE